MIESSAIESRAASYELRFTGLFNRGRGYVFPCDAQGRVNIGELTERARGSYRFACSVVGSELSTPVVAPVARTGRAGSPSEPCGRDDAPVGVLRP